MPDLFFQYELADKLRDGQSLVESSVNGISKDQFAISSEDQLKDYVLAKLKLLPLQLFMERKTMSHDEVNFDPSPENRFGSYGTEKKLIPGIRLVIRVPFVGHPWLFDYRPSSFWSLHPKGRIESDGDVSGEVHITIVRPISTDARDIKRDCDAALKLLQDYVDSSSSQVCSYNDSIVVLAKRAISGRRERLEKHSSVARLLDIPLHRRSDAIPTRNIEVTLRPPPKLPSALKDGPKPEPGISDQSYEHILEIIRHSCRTFESYPSTYSKLEEEDIRNILLSNLNSHLKGKASGEVFRKKGKTDIHIEAENRSAFVGECKLWSGQSSVVRALDQLLGYLTWRDSKAALVVLNKSVKSFSTVVSELPQAAIAHPLYVGTIESREHGEWRFSVRSSEDENRQVTLHCFAVDIFSR